MRHVDTIDVVYRSESRASMIASRIPSAPLGVVEVRPCRDLVVEGVSYKASRKSR
jgi:hypothetical protein